jgi:hypothetical protein
VSARRPRKYHPLHVAFTATTAAIVLLVAGSIGFTIKRSNWYFFAGTWSDGVVWQEIYYGLVALALAAYFWKKGLSVPTA